MAEKSRKYSIEDLNELIDSIKMDLNLNIEQISTRMGYNEGYISQVRTRGQVPDKFMESLKREFAKSQPVVSYLKQRQEIKNGKTKGIPVYEANPVTLTNTPTFRDEHTDMDSPDFWITIPNLRDCNYGTRAKGDSMHPLIRTNALVIGREIIDFKVIIFGEIYIVKTKSGIETVKYIHPHETDKDVILLVPYNEKAKTTPIHKSDLLKLYEAKAVFNTI